MYTLTFWFVKRNKLEIWKSYPTTKARNREISEFDPNREIFPFFSCPWCFRGYFLYSQWLICFLLSAVSVISAVKSSSPCPLWWIFFLIFQGFSWYSCARERLVITKLLISPKFLLSRASLYGLRNFVLSWGYHLWGDPLGGLGSNLGGCFRSRLLSRFGGWFGSGLRGNFGDNLGSGFGSKLRSNFGSGLGSSPLSNLGSRFGGWHPYNPKYLKPQDFHKTSLFIIEVKLRYQ